LLQGQGEPHLRTVLDRLKSRFGVEVVNRAAVDAVSREHAQEAPKCAAGTRSKPAGTASSAIASFR
jgi:translation elongation factor EF-G